VPSTAVAGAEPVFSPSEFIGAQGLGGWGVWTPPNFEKDVNIWVILIPLSLISFFTFFFINKITKSWLITKNAKQ
jgi:hypothetical protein